jgi:hypothetical protein
MEIPKYFIQTKSGTYTGMIKHNFEKCFSQVPGT